MDWLADWIWTGREPSPRNEWWCFRKTFEVPDEGWDTARICLTADSRYVLYLNGERIGRGPVRSWPFEQSYDTHEVGHLLRPGEANTLAVLVLHFGVSTFYYLRGRGGLLAQLDLMHGDEPARTIATDTSWKTARYLAQDSRSPRMSCQHAFAERIDARTWDPGWTKTGFDDSSWPGGAIVGPVGMEPWSALVARDIPPLTEEPVRPSRVESLRRVVPVRWTAAVDVRNQMAPGSEDHANPVTYAGYLATIVRASEACRARFSFPTFAASAVGACAINGVLHERQEFGGTEPERHLEAGLRAGDNWVVMDVSGYDHGHGFHIGIDSEVPFEVISPVEDGLDGSPFVTIGPFGAVVHGPEDAPYAAEGVSDTLSYIAGRSDEDPTYDPEAYRAAGTVSSREDLARLDEWVRPVPGWLVSLDDVFTACTWVREGQTRPVPASLQSVVAANPVPAEVPLFENADTEMIVDFGRELSGYLAFEVEAPEGTVIDLYGFEYLHDGERQDTFGLDNTLRYVCCGGRQVYESPVRRGLRYLMVVVRRDAGPVRVYGVRMLQSNYPVAEVGAFRCSDALLNEVWEISRHTTRLCMEDTFVDCPAYEQAFWVGDSRNEALINYYIFGGDEIVKRCLRLVPGSKFQSPLYSDQVPSGWSSVIPNWTFFWVVACNEHYLRTEDLPFAREMWPHVCYTLDRYLERLDDCGLMAIRAWNLLDWAPMDQPGDGVVAHQNAFFVRALRAAAWLADTVGDARRSAAYAASAKDLKAAMNEHLWSGEREAYLDSIHADGTRSDTFSVQTQVVAYLCGVAEGERAARIENYLRESPPDFVQIGSPFMSFFYYEALVEAGKPAAMIEDMRENYGRMVDHGATTCWEEYPEVSEHPSRGSRFPTRSHCHAWSAAPGYFLGTTVLGVRTVSPGWRRIVVEPHPCGLTWARGSVPLPGEGRIAVAWELEADGRTMRLRIEAPRGLSVEAKLPRDCDGSVECVRV